jgi:hypothetical protein
MTDNTLKSAAPTTPEPTRWLAFGVAAVAV